MQDRALTAAVHLLSTVNLKKPPILERATMIGTDYRFADGNTFLISSEGGEVNVLQMQLADNKILDLGDLCRDNSIASDFFSQSVPEDRK